LGHDDSTALTEQFARVRDCLPKIAG